MAEEFEGAVAGDACLAQQGQPFLSLLVEERIGGDASVVHVASYE